MPKRRSLAGTAREAIGEPPTKRSEAPPVAPPAKQSRAVAPKSKRAAMPEPTPAPRPEAAPPPERERVAAPRPATASAYEAMMSFASATLRQNMETGARLARCKSPMEALATQTAHATAVAQSLLVVSLKLMQLGFTSTNWASLRSPVAR